MRFHGECEWTICGWFNAPSPSTKTHKMFIKWLFSEWIFFYFSDWLLPTSRDQTTIESRQFDGSYYFWSEFGVLMCTWAFAIFVCYNLSHLAQKRNHLVWTHLVATFFSHAFDSINWNLMGNIKINYFVIGRWTYLKCWATRSTHSYQMVGKIKWSKL